MTKNGNRSPKIGRWLPVQSQNETEKENFFLFLNFVHIKVIQLFLSFQSNSMKWNFHFRFLCRFCAWEVDFDVISPKPLQTKQKRSTDIDWKWPESNMRQEAEKKSAPKERKKGQRFESFSSHRTKEEEEEEEEDKTQQENIEVLESNWLFSLVNSIAEIINMHESDRAHAQTSKTGNAFYNANKNVFAHKTDFRTKQRKWESNLQSAERRLHALVSKIHCKYFYVSCGCKCVRFGTFYYWIFISLAPANENSFLWKFIFACHRSQAQKHGFDTLRVCLTSENKFCLSTKRQRK